MRQSLPYFTQLVVSKTLTTDIPAAEHLFVRAQSRGPDDVPEVTGCAGLARTDGSLAGRAKAPQRNRGSAADRACQEMARLAPAEILTASEKRGPADSPSEKPSPNSALFENRYLSLYSVAHHPAVFRRTTGPYAA